MAIAAVHKGSENLGLGTSLSTASRTPAAGALQLLLIEVALFDGTVTSVSNFNGGTWVLVDSNINYDGSGLNDAFLYRALIASPTAGTAVINLAGATGGHVAISWMEFTGVDTSGTNGSGAIVQHLKATGSSGTASKTLAAFSSANNATFGGIDTANDNTITAGSGFTIAGQVGGPPTGHCATEYQLANDTTVDATFTSSPWSMFASEIKAATAKAPPPFRRNKNGLFLRSIRY